MSITDWTRLVIALGYAVAAALSLFGVHRVLPSVRPTMYLGTLIMSVWSLWYWYLALENPVLTTTALLINHTAHFGTLTFIGLLIWKQHQDYLHRKSTR